MQDILTTKIYTLIRKITSPPISEKKTYYILVAALQWDANHMLYPVSHIIQPLHIFL